MPVQAIILAAGFGTRLYPLTRERAKPLLSVAGRPVVEHVLERVLEVPEAERVLIVTNGQFEKAFLRWRSTLPETTRRRTALVSDGVTEPEGRLGAVGDLRLGLEQVAGSPPDAPGGPVEGYLVLAADNLFGFSLSGLIETWRGGEGAGAAVAVHDPEPLERLAGKGMACVGEGGRVVRASEKPRRPACPPGTTARRTAAIYAFGPDLPRWIDRFLDGGGEPDAPGHFLEWLSGTDVGIVAHAVTGYRFDIGTPERYREACAFFGSEPEGGS